MWKEENATYLRLVHTLLPLQVLCTPITEFIAEAVERTKTLVESQGASWRTTLQYADVFVLMIGRDSVEAHVKNIAENEHHKDPPLMAVSDLILIHVSLDE